MLTLSQKVKSSCYQALLIDCCILFLKANVAAVLANFLSFDCLPQEGMELDKSRAGKSSPKGSFFRLEVYHQELSHGSKYSISKKCVLFDTSCFCVI